MLNQEYFPENDLPKLTWQPDVIVMTCRGRRGDMCHSKIG
jgi:hypothetical protein